LSHIRQDDLLELLEKIGRLVAFTRQLDTALKNDSIVQDFAENFLQENFNPERSFHCDRD
jgi:hypothetical protein